MEEFKKDLLKVCGKNTAALIIFFVLGGVFLAFGLLMWITAYDPFDHRPMVTQQWKLLM